MRRPKHPVTRGEVLFVGIDLHKHRWHVTIRTFDIELFSASCADHLARSVLVPQVNRWAVERWEGEERGGDGHGRGQGTVFGAASSPVHR